MELLQHTNHWLNGEIFEGKIILLAGGFLLLLSLIFWKLGVSAHTRALIIPTLILGMLHAATGSYMIYSNTQRKAEFRQAIKEDPAAFRQQEIHRTEDFMQWYPPVRYVSVGIILGGFCLLNFIVSPTWKAVGICLMALGLSIIVIDYFSEQRAIEYYEALTNGW